MIVEFQYLLYLTRDEGIYNLVIFLQLISEYGIDFD